MRPALCHGYNVPRADSTNTATVSDYENDANIWAKNALADDDPNEPLIVTPWKRDLNDIMFYI